MGTGNDVPKPVKGIPGNLVLYLLFIRRTQRGVEGRVRVIARC